MAEAESTDGALRTERVGETLLRFQKEIERLLRVPRLQYRKDDFQGLQQRLAAISDEANELSSNFLIMRLVLGKSRQETRGCDGLGLAQLDKTLQ